MGLDMFLFRRKNSDTKSEAFTEVGFWRKANHIHNWFVVNCQDGVDECQETEISKENLEELLSICKKVLNPTGSSLHRELACETAMQAIFALINLIRQAVTRFTLYKVEKWEAVFWHNFM